MRAFVTSEGFGELRAGMERKIGNCVFRLYRSEGGAVYESECNGDARRLRVEAEELSIVPAPPVLADPRISQLVMLRFEEPVLIDARKRSSIETCMPVDIAVVLGELLVEARPAARVKYALYGELDRGVLARVARSSSASPCAKLRVELVNNSSKPALVSRVVFPGYMLLLCYRGTEVYSNPLRLTIMDNFGVVQPLEPDWSAECTRAPMLLRAPLFEKQRFAMMFGF